jgi:hypothetical protein
LYVSESECKEYNLAFTIKFAWYKSKIVNKEEPDYLYELVPPLVAANVNYNLRNSHNIHVPFIRLSVLQNSYFPCTIQLTILWKVAVF